MKTNRLFSALFILMSILFLGPGSQPVSARAEQEASTPLALVVATTAQVEWQIQVENNGADLTILGPGGLSVQQTFSAGVAPLFALSANGQRRPSGVYQYELAVHPRIDAQTLARLAAARQSSQEAQLEQELRQQGLLPEGPFTQSGSFWVPESAAPPVVAAEADAARQDPTGLITPQDAVTTDDAIIQGSICVGLDCVNNETFGYDTLRLKENNNRIKFEDTSSTAGFTTHDWQLTANDAANGGLERFIIEDVTAATQPFYIMGSAPTNALVVNTNGKIGLRTATPVLDLHINTTNTPAIRFEQNNGGGFTAQTWDIGANEANFFVRDLTHGSLLPLRVRPGAPTSSLDISASGNVGIGTGSPEEKLDVKGNILVDGYVMERSDRNAKTNFSSVDGQTVLDRLQNIPVLTWNYKDDPQAAVHMGPMAQDFYSAFGLGADDKHIAALDTNGVALAAIQELNRQVADRDAKITNLEARIAALEARQTAQPVSSLLNTLAPLALGLLGLAAGMGIARKKTAGKA
jgi:hypothetical protein